MTEPRAPTGDSLIDPLGRLLSLPSFTLSPSPTGASWDHVPTNHLTYVISQALLWGESSLGQLLSAQNGAWLIAENKKRLLEEMNRFLHLRSPAQGGRLRNFGWNEDP